jgi:hypothetical protein
VLKGYGRSWKQLVCLHHLGLEVLNNPVSPPLFAELIDPMAQKLKCLISLYNPVSILSVPYSNRPLKPLTPLNRLNAIFVLAVDRNRESPHLCNWSMSCNWLVDVKP